VSKAKSVFISLVVVTSFIFGLILGYSLPRQSPVANNTALPSITLSPTSSVAGTTTETVIVTKVIDGDTIRIQTGQTVRLIGIDTPEITRIECFGKEASLKLSDLILDKQVRLEKDVSETDRYGRILRYVWLGDELINETLVKQGFARSYRYPPDTKYQERFDIAQTFAQLNRLGLWQSCMVSPTPLSNSQPNPTQVLFVNDSNPSNTTESIGNNSSAISNSDCQIKGNISSTGKIFHMPGCGSYEKTVIDESAGERYFCTEAEAVSAGWRKAKNC
jgi:micrococcal nuclease